MSSNVKEIQRNEGDSGGLNRYTKTSVAGIFCYCRTSKFDFRSFQKSFEIMKKKY